MATAEKLPFSWHSVESLPDLERLRLVLATLAEGKKDASDPDADWGKHETSGVNARTGKIWKKVKTAVRN